MSIPVPAFLEEAHLDDIPEPTFAEEDLLSDIPLPSFVEAIPTQTRMPTQTRRDRAQELHSLGLPQQHQQQLERQMLMELPPWAPQQKPAPPLQLSGDRFSAFATNGTGSANTVGPASANRKEAIRRLVNIQYVSDSVSARARANVEMPEFQPARRQPTAQAAPDVDLSMRSQLQDLQNVDCDHVVRLRKIHKLGINSPAILEAHYSQYGKVQSVCVPHGTVRPRIGGRRVRPSGLGFIVMSEASEAQAILAAGQEQIIHHGQGGRQSATVVEVHAFQKHCDLVTQASEDMNEE